MILQGIRLLLSRVHVVGAQDGPGEEDHALLRAALGASQGSVVNAKRAIGGRLQPRRREGAVARPLDAVRVLSGVGGLTGKVTQLHLLKNDFCQPESFSWSWFEITLIYYHSIILMPVID